MADQTPIRRQVLTPIHTTPTQSTVSLHMDQQQQQQDWINAAQTGDSGTIPSAGQRMISACAGSLLTSLLGKQKKRETKAAALNWCNTPRTESVGSFFLTLFYSCVLIDVNSNTAGRGQDKTSISNSSSDTDLRCPVYILE